MSGDGQLDGGLPREYLTFLAKHGLAGIVMPEAAGGQGGSLLDAVLVIKTVAQVCPTAGDCVQALNFGAIQQVARHGSPAQKARYLAPALRGERLLSIAMTEPEAGSAVTDLEARARCDGDHVVVDGQKIFTTNAATADDFVAWVKFGPRTRDAGAVIASDRVLVHDRLNGHTPAELPNDRGRGNAGTLNDRGTALNIWIGDDARRQGDAHADLRPVLVGSSGNHATPRTPEGQTG